MWFYSTGFKRYYDKWVYCLGWINHYFSTFLLLRTLFAPWKRLIIVEKEPGFNFTRFFQNLTFNAISRSMGAIVRLSLFLISLLSLSITLVVGAIGFVFWTIFPFFGLFLYSTYKKSPGQFSAGLINKLKAGGDNAIVVLFNNEAGRFLLSHTNLTQAELVENGKVVPEILSGLTANSFEQIVDAFIKAGVWTGEFLRSKGVSEKDLILAASWWDRKRRNLSETEGKQLYGRPGIGLELLFGYTPTLNQYSVDMAIPQDFSHHLIGREDIVSKMGRELVAGNSVILVGQPGVGKRTIVLEFAHRAAQGKLGEKMSYKRVVEFDYNYLLSETGDLNLKKTKLAEVLNEASSAGNIILVIRDIQRLTNSDVEGFDFTDTLEEYLEKGKLKIIVISTPTDYERFIVPNLRLVKFFGEVEAEPPSLEEATQILIEAADNWERSKKIIVPVPSLRKILEGSDRYITDIPFPEKALELLDAVIVYMEEKGRVTMLPEDVDLILSEKTGISFANLTDKRKVQLTNLEEIIHERLVDQKIAVNLIAKSLRSKTVGVAEQKRPIGSFLFMGPTGVGKTETAKVLAKVYFGSEENILRFNMNEYAGREGLERLIGSVTQKQPGILTTEIKNHPASLLLLDEIEKAPRDIVNMFLALLDEGVITDALGRKILCRHLFVIATSNAGTEYIRKLVEKGTKPEDMQKLVIDYVLKERLFSPEFINRFDGVIVYQPLSEEDLAKVAKFLLNDLVENLKNKNIYLTITDEVVKKVAKDGYVPEFGARPMKRIINLLIGDIIGQAILKGEINAGDRILLIPKSGENEYGIQKVEK